MVKKSISLIVLILILSILTGCASGMGIRPTSENTSNQTNILAAPPMPTQSTCENGSIETIVLSNDGSTVLWYYRDNAFLSLKFEPGRDVRITVANERVFCYDNF